MKTELLMLLAVFVPVVAAFILPFIGAFSPRLRNLVSLFSVLTSLVTACAMIPSVLAGQIATISLQMPLGFNFILTADCLAVFMAVTSSLVGAVIVLYSFGYISHYENQNEYYLLVTLFLGSMMGIVFSANLIFLYMFWEITAIASWRLIGFFRDKTFVLRADKSFLITMGGALMMLLGFIMIYQQAGSFDMAVIRETLKTSPVADAAVILVLCGILAKSATLPFHTWLPDAGVAPSPVTALLHAAVLVKIGVYVYARLFIVDFPISEIWNTAVPVIAGASALVSAGAAMVDTDIKRIIAYSTVSQIGFIFLGLSTGSEVGIAGGLLYILTHSIAKGGLFLGAGVIEQKTHCKDITKLGGLLKTMPVTGTAFLLCAFSVMGIPPFGGFFAKYMVIGGALSSGHLWIALTFLAGAFMTLIYLFRLFTMVFMGEAKCETPREGSPVMVTSVALLAVLALASGLFISFLAGPLKITVLQMLSGR